MFKTVILLPLLIFFASCNPELANGLRKKDRVKDIAMVTDHGTMIIRLFDSTPLHRDNFIKLVKQHFYDGMLFHRVIQHFMIQAGDAATSVNKAMHKDFSAKQARYTVPAEFIPALFHKKGVIAAAREGDDNNSLKASSGSQFYLVQGKVFTNAGLDSVEIFRLKGRKLPPAHREIYKTLGGAPHLDMNYTVFGEVINGLPVIDKIAAEPTSGRQQGDKPLKDIRIIKAYLVKRKFSQTK